MQLAEAVRFWEHFLGFIVYAENMLRCMNPTTAELVQKYHSAYPRFEPVSECARRCSSGTPFPEAWDQSITVLQRGRKLPADAARIMREFGAGLGATDIQGQLNHMALYRTQGQEKRMVALETQRNKSRMYVVLGATMGLGLDLLLI